MASITETRHDRRLRWGWAVVRAPLDKIVSILTGEAKGALDSSDVRSYYRTTDG